MRRSSVDGAREILALSIAGSVVFLVAALVTGSELADRIVRSAYATDPPGSALHFDYYFQRFYSLMARPVLLATGLFLCAAPLLLAAVRRKPRGNGFRPAEPRRPGRVIAVLAAAAFVAASLAAAIVLRGFPNSADEWAFQFQAEAFADGEVARSPGNHPLVAPLGTSYFVHFRDGKLFSAMFPGWPLLLAAGLKAGVGTFVNPLLGAAGIVLLYFAGKAAYGTRAGLVAAGIAAISPFFILESGSLFSHPTSFACTSGALWLVLRVRRLGSARLACAAGAFAGYAFDTRPLTGLALAVPLVVALATGKQRFRSVAAFAAGFGAIAGLLLAFNTAVTGSPFMTPYAWAGIGDRLGFYRSGYNVHSPWDGAVQLAGRLLDLAVWLPAPTFPLVGLALLRSRGATERLLAGVPAAIALAYFVFISYGGNQYGPRYYYEAVPCLAILAARGWLELRSALDRRALVATGVAAAAIHAGALVWLLGTHARIVRERALPFDLARESGLRNAVVLLDTGSGTMEAMDLVRNAPCCEEGVVWAPSPRIVAQEAGESTAEAYAEVLRRTYSERDFWIYRYGDPIARGIESECVRWPIEVRDARLVRASPW